MNLIGRFSLGTVVITQGIKALVEDEQSPLSYAALLALIHRHRMGDDGDVCPDDAQANLEAIEHHLRIFSVYQLESITIWIITEADRSSTTILLPEEY